MFWAAARPIWRLGRASFGREEAQYMLLGDLSASAVSALKRGISDVTGGAGVSNPTERTRRCVEPVDQQLT